MNEQNEIQVDQNNMYFYQGTEELFLKNKLDDNNKKLSFLKQKITDFLNIKNIHFLFGAGVSSKSIPTMKQFVSLIIKKIKQEDEKLKFLKLFAKLSKYQKSNLEDILGVLYSKREYQKGIKEEDLDTEKLIKIIESTIFEGINVDISDNSHENTIKLYETFYQRTAYRSKDFSRINIFTTNNDLFNERVLDRLNINFN